MNSLERLAEEPGWEVKGITAIYRTDGLVLTVSESGVSIVDEDSEWDGYVQLMQNVTGERAAWLGRCIKFALESCEADKD